MRNKPKAINIKKIVKKYFGKSTEQGLVFSVIDGIATVTGLPNLKSGEMVRFEPSGMMGMALNLNSLNVNIVIFGNEKEVQKGHTVVRTGVVRTGSSLRIPVGKELLGRVVDVLGNSLDKSNVICKEKK